jgi:hypothetical protein
MHQERREVAGCRRKCSLTDWKRAMFWKQQGCTALGQLQILLKVLQIQISYFGRQCYSSTKPDLHNRSSVYNVGFVYIKYFINKNSLMSHLSKCITCVLLPCSWSSHCDNVRFIWINELLFVNSARGYVSVSAQRVVTPYSGASVCSCSGTQVFVGWFVWLICHKVIPNLVA